MIMSKSTTGARPSRSGISPVASTENPAAKGRTTSKANGKHRPLPDLEAAAKNYDAAVEVIGREETGKGIRALFELASCDKAFQELVKIAERFEVPLWVMMLPDMPPGHLTKENMQGLVRHVEGYLQHGDAIAGDRAVLKDRLSAQRTKLFEAQAIVQSVAAGLNPGDWPAGQPGYPFALNAADDMLDSIANELDPVILMAGFEGTGRAPEEHEMGEQS